MPGGSELSDEIGEILETRGQQFNSLAVWPDAQNSLYIANVTNAAATPPSFLHIGLGRPQNPPEPIVVVRIGSSGRE